MASRAKGPRDLRLKSGELDTLPMVATDNKRNTLVKIPFMGTTWVLLAAEDLFATEDLIAAKDYITEQLGKSTCSAGHPIKVTSARLRLKLRGLYCTLQFEHIQHNELHIKDRSFAKLVGQVIAASVGAAQDLVKVQVADSAAIQDIRRRHRGSWYIKVSAEEARGLQMMLNTSRKRGHDEIDQPTTTTTSALDIPLILWPSFMVSLNSGASATLTPDCGKDLHDLLRQCYDEKDYTENPQFVQQLVAQVHNGLAALHALGLVHGDVKKENILVQNLHAWNEQDPIDVKLIDFEGVRRVNDSGGMCITKRRSDFVGSLSSMSADRLRDDYCRPSKQDDLYAIFVLMYNMLNKMDFFYMEHVTMNIPIAETRAPLRSAINTGLSCTLYKASIAMGCSKAVQSVKDAVETALQQPVGAVKCTSLRISNVSTHNADDCDVLRCSMAFDGVAIATLLGQPTLLQQLASAIVCEVCQLSSSSPVSSVKPFKASYSAAPELLCMWDGIRPDERRGEDMTPERLTQAAEMLDQHVPGVCKTVRCTMKARGFDSTWHDAIGEFAGRSDTISPHVSRFLRDEYRTK